MSLPPRRIGGKSVFIVHGHDETTRDLVSSTLLEGGFKPMVLAEYKKGFGSTTIIEKFEVIARSSNYAVVIMSPDDKDYSSIPADESKEEKFRARQNVFIELGWFFAFLGRERVVVLVVGDENTLEIPSDIVGCEVVFSKGDIEKAAKTLLEKLE